MFIRSLTVIATIFFFSCSHKLPETTIRFTYNGKPFEPIFERIDKNGSKEKIKVFIGDLFKLTLLLEKQDSYDFTDFYNEYGRVWITLNKKKRLISLADIDKETISGLNPEDLKYLTKIQFCGNSSKEACKLLSEVDLKNICIEAGVEYLEHIPHNVINLHIIDYEMDSQNIDKHISKFKSLETLGIYNTFHKIISADTINNLPKLKLLELSRTSISGSQNLKVNKSIENLTLYRCYIDRIKDLQNFPNLKSLKLLKIKIDDLSAISGLKNLKFLNTNNSTISDLALVRSEQLKEVNLLGAKIEKESVTKFKLANPGCKIIDMWSDPLKNKLKDITLVRISGEGLYPGIIFDIKGKKQIKELIENIVLHEKPHEAQCSCGSFLFVNFYSGNEQKVSLSLGSGTSIDWINGVWPARGTLSQKTIDYFNNDILKPYDICVGPNSY